MAVGDVRAGEKGSSEAVITRRDGSREIVDKDTGDLKREYNPEGTRVVRITTKKSSGGGSGGSGGTVRVEKVTAPVEVENQKRNTQNKAISARNKEILRQRENALREGNFSEEDGGISKITYLDEQAQSKATTEQLEDLRGGVPQYKTLQEAPRRSALGRAKDEFIDGFKAGSGLDYDPAFVGRVRSGARGSSTFAEEAGLLVGSVAPFVGAANAPRGLRLATSAEAAVKATPVAKAVLSTRVGRFGTGLLTGVGETVAIIEVGKSFGTRNLTPQQKELLDSPLVREAIMRGRQAEIEAVNEGGFPVVFGEKSVNVNPRAIGFELVGTKLSGEKGREAFEEGIRANLETSSLSDYEKSLAVRAALVEKKSVDNSELAAFLNIARFSEGFGRREINRVFKDVPVKGNVGVKTGFIAAPSIGTAGFIEGFSQEIGQQNVRELPLSLQNAAAMGGFGALSAAVLGGVIAGGGVVKSPTSRLVEYGSYVTDPFEKPGDLFQDVTEGALSRSRSRVIAAQPLFVGDSKQLIRDINPAISAVDTLPKTPGVIVGNEFSTLTTSLNPAARTKVLVPSQSQISSDVFSSISNPVGSPVPSPVSSPIKIPSTVDTRLNTPLNVLSNINFPVNVPVSSNTQTPVTVPVVISEQGFFPLPFPSKPGGSDAPLTRKKGGKKKKGSATTSLFQQLFEVPDYLVVNQKGSSEKTGIFLRN